MSVFAMARIRRLNLGGLAWSEEHARRLTEKAQKRVVREAPPVTWTPGNSTADPLDYPQLYDAHVEGAFVPKGAGKALHLLVKLPESVPVETTEEAEAALRLVVDFGRTVFGDEAVFAGRMDRDEKTLTNAELFIAPRYVKRTKHTEKVAISLSRHLKQLAKKYGDLPQDKDILRRQGQVLQDEFARFLRSRGYQALRGVPKKTREPDWTSPEAYGSRTDRAIGEAHREMGNEMLAEAAAREDAADEQARNNRRDQEQIERERSMLADERAGIEKARDDFEQARRRILDAADADARRIVAEAEQLARVRHDLADEDARRILTDAEGAARHHRRIAEEQADRVRADAMDAADQITAAAAADAAAQQRVLDQRQRLIETQERRAADATASAVAAANRARIESEAAASVRREAHTLSSEAQRRHVAVEQASQSLQVASAQIALVARAVGDEALTPTLAPDAPSGLAIRDAAMTIAEQSAYRSPWSDVSRAVARGIAAALQKVAELKRAAEGLMRQATAQKAAVDQERAELRGAEQKLNADRYLFIRDRQQLEKQRQLAVDFVAAWSAVPSAERTPPIAAALKLGGVLGQAARLPTSDKVNLKGPTASEGLRSQLPTREGTEM